MSTLLQGVNEVLKKAQIVSRYNPLTSLNNSSKQVFIDNAIQSWGEAVDQLYISAEEPKPNALGTDTITLVVDKRQYALPDDLVQIVWPLHDETNGQWISEYPGGYQALRASQNYPDNYTGQPFRGAIHPENGDIYFDRVPTSDVAGRVYQLQYTRDLTLSRASDELPFNDTVYRAMIPVVTELYRYNQNNRINGGVLDLNYGRAIRALKRTYDGDTYISRRRNYGFDPYYEHEVK